jgi:hypothetical protein
MNFTINVLKKKSEEVYAEIKRIEGIENFEMVSDILFVEEELKNLKLILNELQEAILYLNKISTNKNEQKNNRKSN